MGAAFLDRVVIAVRSQPLSTQQTLGAAAYELGVAPHSTRSNQSSQGETSTDPQKIAALKESNAVLRRRFTKAEEELFKLKESCEVDVVDLVKNAVRRDSQELVLGCDAMQEKNKALRSAKTEIQSLREEFCHE